MLKPIFPKLLHQVMKTEITDLTIDGTQAARNNSKTQTKKKFVSHV